MIQLILIIVHLTLNIYPNAPEMKRQAKDGHPESLKKLR
jgi:hypothetical protein